MSYRANKEFIDYRLDRLNFRLSRLNYIQGELCKNDEQHLEEITRSARLLQDFISNLKEGNDPNIDKDIIYTMLNKYSKYLSQNDFKFCSIQLQIIYDELLGEFLDLNGILNSLEEGEINADTDSKGM